MGFTLNQNWPSSGSCMGQYETLWMSHNYYGVAIVLASKKKTASSFIFKFHAKIAH